MTWDEVFDDDYLWFYETFLTDELSDEQADLVWRLLDLEPGADVLDLACGHGRIANRLAARGARVVGLDASERFLELARADAAARGVDVEYVHGDMRSLPWEGRFDAIANWFTAFGYFSDEENRTVLREARRALRDGGRLLINLNHLPGLLRELRETHVTERGDDLMLDRSTFDVDRSVMRTRRIVVKSGNIRSFDFEVRMFAFPELRDWLLAAGFTSVLGVDGRGDALALESYRMNVIATR